MGISPSTYLFFCFSSKINFIGFPAKDLKIIEGIYHPGWFLKIWDRMDYLTSIRLFTSDKYGI